MEGKDLRALRTSFGWSQERLAEELGVDVTTVSRWERGKTREPMTGTIIEAIGRNILSGRMSRASAYVDAVVSPQLKATIDHHPGFRFLVFGERLIVLRQSQCYLARYPMAKIVQGLSMVDFMDEKGMEIYRAALALMRDVERHDSIASIKSYAAYNGSKIPGYPRVWREYTFAMPMPMLFDVAAQDISKEEYDSQPEKFIVVPL